GSRVLDGVPHVGARNLDREANLAVSELFDLRLHARPLEQTGLGLSRARSAPRPRFRRVAHPSASIVCPSAGVAELVDAPGLGPGGACPLEVRVLSPAIPGEVLCTPPG